MIGDKVGVEEVGVCVCCHTRAMLGDGLCQRCWDRQASKRTLPDSALIEELLDVYQTRHASDELPHATVARCVLCNIWTGGALWCSACRPVAFMGRE